MTGGLFDDPTVAAGYATARPAVHPALVARVGSWSGWSGPVGRALDVGCGAGASTAALAPLAAARVGVDPAPAMVAAARDAVPGCSFAVGRAEALPVADASVGLVSAAGVLNFADLDRACDEAARVLEPAGVLVVADYGFGRPGARPGWPEELRARWPRPPARPVGVAEFDRGPFAVVEDAPFVTTLSMTLDDYVAYAMTDTSVVAAVAAGADPAEIRAWCRATLADGWSSGRVEFDCSVLLLTPR
ncbi:MAG: class I SAM-dependent methyltransferase [Acidimicrobiia bacterium]